MRNKPGMKERLISLFIRLLLVGLMFCIPVQTLAQGTATYEAERKRALQLYDENKFADAIPLLEKLVSINSSDTVLLERLGWATLVVSASMQNAELRKQARNRARELLNRAKELGDNSELLRMGMEALNQPDSAEIPFSSVKNADAAMREGEEAHSRGELDKAIAAYQRALQFDPKLYLAALFVGDMYYKKAHQASDPAVQKSMVTMAGEWFARAIEIDKNIETAYRYWGDALMLISERDGAKEKFIDAIVADPYSRNPYVGLRQWGAKYSVNLAHPKVPNPLEAGQTVDSNDPKTAGARQTPAYYWSLYAPSRQKYKVERFQRDHPTERGYRNSLQEETAGLQAVASAVASDLQAGKLEKISPDLESLVQLYKAGLIEAYVLFARADRDIARDYSAYREANRDKLRRYWNEFVISN